MMAGHACKDAAKGAASALSCAVMRHIEAAAGAACDSDSAAAVAPACEPNNGKLVEHVVLVDARLWQESHEEIEAKLRPNAKAVYIARPCEVAIYLDGLTDAQRAAIRSWNLLFHGSPYDADAKPIRKDDPALADRAVTIEVLGAKLSVVPADVERMVAITPASTPAERAQSRAAYPAYWELREAMTLLWNATQKQQAPFFLYACNLAKIKGFQRLFTGFGRPVYGSTDVTGPPPYNWRVEWESENGNVEPHDETHAEDDVFVRPGEMKLELPMVDGVYVPDGMKGWTWTANLFDFNYRRPPAPTKPPGQPTR